MDHSHECRDCGSSIECHGTDDRTCWDGGNDRCETLSCMIDQGRRIPTENRDPKVAFNKNWPSSTKVERW